MKTNLRLVFKMLSEGRNLFRHFIRQHIASRVGTVNAVGAIRLHQQRLLEKILLIHHMRHHQKTDRIHTQVAPHPDVLLGYVGLSAVRSNTNGRGAKVAGHANVIQGSNPWHMEHRNACLLHFWHDSA